MTGGGLVGAGVGAVGIRGTATVGIPITVIQVTTRTAVTTTDMGITGIMDTMAIMGIMEMATFMDIPQVQEDIAGVPPSPDQVEMRTTRRWLQPPGDLFRVAQRPSRN
jgi:hypothetical protein